VNKLWHDLIKAASRQVFQLSLAGLSFDYFFFDIKKSW